MTDKLFGRSQFVGRLVADARGLSIIEGDSGIGKTSCLEAFVAVDRHSTASRVISVQRAPGGLQVALVEGLSEVCAQTVTSILLTRLGRRITNASKAVASARMSDVARGVGRLVLSTIRARVGEEFADLLEDFASELSSPYDDASLIARIEEARKEDVIITLLALMGEVAQVIGNYDVVFDNAQRLQGDDFQRLLGVSDLLPEGVSIIAAFSNVNQVAASQITELQLAGATLFTVPPLGRDQICEWLISENLSPELSYQVLQSTNGYPEYVASAIELLHASDGLLAINSLSPTQVLEAATRAALRSLSPSARSAAVALLPYPDPLSTDRVCDLLGINPAQWASERAELRDSRVFVGQDRPWFHDLRRAVIRDVVLVADEYSTALVRARAELSLELEKDSSGLVHAELLVNWSLITVDLLFSGGLIDKTLTAIAEVPLPELAVLGSLLELFEGEDKFLPADLVLTHARSRFQVRTDLRGQLQSLKRKGLIAFASNDWNAVALPVWPHLDSMRLTAGLVANRLGTLPTPKIGTTYFNVLRRFLSGFTYASYGLGATDLSDMAEQAKLLHLRPPDGGEPRWDPVHSLLLQYKAEGVRFHAAVAFSNSADAADAAKAIRVADLSNRHGIDLLCSELIPGEVIPSIRPVQIIERAFGFDLANAERADSTAGRAKWICFKRASCAAEQKVRQRLEALRTLRYLFDERELLIMGIGPDPIGGVWADSPAGGELTALIAGFDGIRQLPLDEGGFALATPFTSFSLVERAGLPLEARMLNVTATSSARPNESGRLSENGSAYTSEIRARLAKLSKFNQYQNVARLPYDVTEIQGAVDRNAEIVEREAQGLASVQSLGPAVGATTGSVLLLIGRPVQGTSFVEGAMETGIVLVSQTGGGAPARVAWLEEGVGERIREQLWTAEGDKAEWVRSVTGDPTFELSSARETSVLDLVSEWCGYAPLSELRLTRPQIG